MTAFGYSNHRVNRLYRNFSFQQNLIFEGSFAWPDVTTFESGSNPLCPLMLVRINSSSAGPWSDEFRFGPMVRTADMLNSRPDSGFESET